MIFVHEMIGLQIPTSLNERSHSSLDNTPPTWTAPEIQAVSGLDSQVNHAQHPSLPLQSPGVRNLEIRAQPARRAAQIFRLK